MTWGREAAYPTSDSAAMVTGRRRSPSWRTGSSRSRYGETQRDVPQTNTRVHTAGNTEDSANAGRPLPGRVMTNAGIEQGTKTQEKSGLDWHNSQRAGDQERRRPSHGRRRPSGHDAKDEARQPQETTRPWTGGQTDTGTGRAGGLKQP